MTPAQTRAVESFVDAARNGPLEEAALRLALTEEPELELKPWREQLERLSGALRERLDPEAPPAHRLDVMRGYLFGELGLMGNEEDYYDPRNSYLHHVLGRGLGIPISLAVVALEVGRRAGLELFGVGFPAHFLVGAEGGVYLDPFHQGRLLSVEDCADLLRRISGGSVPFIPEMLEAVDDEQILLRMLRNLKGCHLRRGELDLALLDVERLLRLRPEPRELRDRGLLRLARQDFAQAVDDLEAYLAHDPPDAAEVRGRLDQARRGLAGEAGA